LRRSRQCKTSGQGGGSKQGCTAGNSNFQNVSLSVSGMKFIKSEPLLSWALQIQ
jgi:hypothetical protein